MRSRSINKIPVVLSIGPARVFIVREDVTIFLFFQVGSDESQEYLSLVTIFCVLKYFNACKHVVKPSTMQPMFQNHDKLSPIKVEE